MNKPIVIDKRTVRLEEVIKADYIPFLGGRPKRSTVIGSDDILNLSIALHTSNTLEDFVRNV